MENDQQQTVTLTRDAVTAFCTESGDLRLTNYELQARLAKAGQIIAQKDAEIAELKAALQTADNTAANGHEPTAFAEAGSRRRGGG